VASLLDRVQGLEQQVRELRGQVEALRNAETTGTADLSKQIADLNFRVQTLENGGRPPVAAGLTSPPPGNLAPPPGAPVAAAAPAATPRRTPEVTLQEGYAALARRDYKAAEAAAREVRSMVGPRNANANFLLAQAMAGQRNWPAAAVAYNDSYDAARNGTHAPDSLLGLANSLVALGDNRAACDALAKLSHEFPRTRDDLREPISATRGHAGCR
jgi:TolA-binding protein